MEHPEIWYPVNKYGGQSLLSAGLGIALAAFLVSLIPGLTLDVYAYIVLGVWVVLFGAAIIASARYLKSF